MEYIKFDNKLLNEYFKDEMGKEDFTLEDVCSQIDEKKDYFMDSFYYMELYHFFKGKQNEPPNKEEHIDTLSKIKSRKFDKISVIFSLESMEISFKDMILLFKIKEQAEKNGKRFPVTLPDKIKGVMINRISEKDYSYEIDIDNFSEVSEEDLLQLNSSLDIDKIEIYGFRGLTPEKLAALGDKQYHIFVKDEKYRYPDGGNPYSIEEIEQLLMIMESMKTNDDQAKDIDKFLSIYKSIGMYVDYDYSAVPDSEEYIKGNGDKAKSLRGALLNGKAVCRGYAFALKFVCDYVGIDAEYVEGKLFEDNESYGHAWNQVRLDGKWYNTDLTNDVDEIRQGKKLTYCLRGDNFFYQDIEKASYMFFHSCSKDYDTDEIAKKLKELPDTDLMKFLFDATEGQSFQESEMQKMVVSVVALNPNFSQTTVQALKEEQQEQQQDGTDR